MYRDVEHIEPLSKQDLIDFYDEHLDPSSDKRAKAAVWLLAQSTSEEAVGKTESSVKDDTASTTSSERKLPPIKEAEVIEDVRAFKARMPLSEGARPVKDLSEFEELEPKL